MLHFPTHKVDPADGDMADISRSKQPLGRLRHPLARLAGVGEARLLRHRPCVKSADRFCTAVSQPHIVFKETAMTWSTPAYTDLRLGFEVTMYVATR